VGTGRVVFSLDFGPKELAFVRERLVAACHRMEIDGWWARSTGVENTKKASEIKFSLGKEIAKAMIARLFK